MDGLGKNFMYRLEFYAPGSRMADEDANELAHDGLLLQLDGMLQARPQFAAATGREFRKAVREAQQPKKMFNSHECHC